MISSLVSFNKLAMENLSQSNLEMAYHFMHRAEKTLSTIPESIEKNSLSLITCNNQACLYKALGQSKQASLFLHRAVEIIPKTSEDHFNLARCFLNLSLLKLEEKDSESALKLALKGLDLLSNNCDEDIDGYYENLGTAFSIIGNSQRANGNEEEAMRAYKRGFDVCSKFLGATHQVTQNLSKPLEVKRYRFTKKPKSSDLVLPKMINRAWPSTVNPKRKEVNRRGSSFDQDYKPVKRKIIFAREPKEPREPKDSDKWQGETLRRTQETFVEKPLSSHKPKKLKKDQKTSILLIQKVFRAFLSRIQLSEAKEMDDSKLTRRQLAEKKAIFALQEFELLRERAERENPY
jgi:tetratricopeptide (TPR) repeat protein